MVDAFGGWVDQENLKNEKNRQNRLAKQSQSSSRRNKMEQFETEQFFSYFLRKIHDQNRNKYL